MSTIDEVVQRVRAGGFIAALLDLAESDVVDDQQLSACPGLEATVVGSIGESSVQIVEEVDAAGIAHGNALFAGPEAESLEDVALPGTCLAGDHQIVVAPYKV